MLLLRSVEMRPISPHSTDFPYTVPFLRRFERMDFSTAVTFLVGENGSGKSTFLEALACVAGSVTMGAESVATDSTLMAVRRFAHDHLKLSWSKRSRKGFFMRSEDFFGYAKRMAQVRAELEADMRAVDEDYKGRSLTAQNLARMPFAGEIHAMQRDYGEGLDSNSHGEGFFKLFQARFVGEGLYLLDEPEAPLSPVRQLALLSLLKQMVDRGGQFIIATHSPLLMAYPAATIYSFDGALRQVEYESLEHVTLTRAFLNNPQAYLRHLFGDDD